MSRNPWVRLWSVAIAFTVFATACAGEAAPVPPEPSSAFGPDDGGVPAPSPVPGDPQPTVPGDDDAPGTGDALARGSVARVEVRGDLDLDVTMDELQEPVILMQPPGGLGMTWSDGGLANLFGIAGVSFTGSRDTDPTTILTLIVRPKGAPASATFVSTGGECTITIDALSDAAARGTFTCRDLTERGGDRTIDAAGSFAARKPS